MKDLFQIDWRIFMAGAEAWLAGRSPYSQLSPEFSAGAFAYPPTALPWLALFSLLGALGYYVWTALQLAGWWMLIRKDRPGQIVLLCWAPMVLHLIEGQSSLAVVLVLWAAFRSPRRGWLWGLACAWAMTKPQVALIPLLWLLWQDRASPLRWRLWGGIVLGTVLLALPATLMNPGIWSDWLVSLGSYRGRILQRAAWQGFGPLLLIPAAYLWYRSRYGNWHWWLAACVFPQTSYYALVPLLPALEPGRNNRTLLGIGLAGILQLPMSYHILPIVLSGQMLAAWLIMGGALRPSVTMARPAAVKA